MSVYVLLWFRGLSVLIYLCVCVSLQNLIKNLPEQKELSALAELKGEYEELCEPEQFGIVVSTAPRKHPLHPPILLPSYPPTHLPAHPGDWQLSAQQRRESHFN